MTHQSAGGMVPPEVLDEALHPQARPNDFGVWGFVMSRASQLT